MVWKDEAGLCDHMGMKVTKHCMVMFQLCKGRAAKRVVFHHTIQQYTFYGML